MKNSAIQTDFRLLVAPLIKEKNEVTPWIQSEFRGFPFISNRKNTPNSAVSRCVFREGFFQGSIPSRIKLSVTELYCSKITLPGENIKIGLLLRIGSIRLRRTKLYPFIELRNTFRHNNEYLLQNKQLLSEESLLFR